MYDQFLFTRIHLSKLFKKYKTGFILLYVVMCVIITFLVFRGIITQFFSDAVLKEMGSAQDKNNIIGFAPEAWLGLLGLVLGTLIIVISVASQSTPKLIDLYTGDQTSLFYIWYIVVGSVHNMFLQLIENYPSEETTIHMLFNTYLMLPSALMLAVPYVLYILRYTKTSNVVEKIYANNIKRVQRLKERAQSSLLNDVSVVAEYQFELFESLNQLDDLLEYVSFKEPKGDIINKISELIQVYVSIKDTLIQYAPNFFEITDRIGTDVSFKTMTGQFDEMKNNRVFYEQKGFRLLGNAYIKLIENDDFDLASLCAYELSECGRKAIECKDHNLIDLILVRFNTLIRFGIKHGLKNQEARNLYNSIFHYSEYIHHIVKTKEPNLIKTSCTYLNRYVNEIYKHSREERSFSFLVDAFTWEFKRILIELNKNEVDIALQKEILGLFLKIDNLSDAHEDISKGRAYSSGVRKLQIALALYYLKNQEKDISLAESIIIDILNDHEHMDRETLRNTVNRTCNELAVAEENFWEDTDRGNLNLYYSNDTQSLQFFMELFDRMLDTYMLLTKRSRNSSSESVE
ncbi:MAG: hypothetical protein NW226_06270 [Microscillaceae bacterium]|nr:hypothetical protein [Microscillaceae bacterium]